MAIIKDFSGEKASTSSYRFLYFGLAALYLLHYAFYGSPILLPDTPMYLPSGAWDFSLVSFTGDLPRPWVVTYFFAVLGYPLKIVIFHYILAFLSGCYLLWTSINISRERPRGFVIIAASSAFLISGPPLEWASSIQSDSLAMTLTLTFVYGIVGFLFDEKHRKLHSGVLLIAGTLASQIRAFVLIFFAPLFAYLIIRIFKSAGSTNFSRKKCAVLMVLMMCSIGYSISLQSKMDLAWGKVLAQHEMVNGRTMQQLGVISMNPVGAQAVDEIIDKGNYSCISIERQDPDVFWWGELAHRCTSEVQQFSNSLVGDYMTYLISHPRRTLQGFGGTYTEAFNFTKGFLPNPLLDLFASRSAYQPTLLVLALLVTALVILPRRLLGQNKALMKFHKTGTASKAVMALMLCGHLAVLISVFYSPSDTYRVASSLTASTLFLTMFLISTAVSWNLHEFTMERYLGSSND